MAGCEKPRGTSQSLISNEGLQLHDYSSYASSDIQKAFINEATVSWNAPVERANGSYLVPSEIGGYLIRFINISNGEHSTTAIHEPHITEYTFYDLSKGKWRFQVATFDSTGLFSDFSEPAFKTID